MKTSDGIAELTKAMVKFQSGMKPALKNATNPHLKSRYADLGACWDAVRSDLAQNGLAVMQSTSMDETNNRVIIETILSHTSGEWIAGQLAMPIIQQTSQAVGSGITYGRRYALCAMLGIVSDEDDDGALSSPPTKTPYAPQSGNTKQPTDINDIKKMIEAVGDALSAKKCLITIMREAHTQEEKDTNIKLLFAKTDTLNLKWNSDKKEFFPK